jgi:toxin ParE1/3/4
VKPAIFHPEAQAELDAAVAWYEAQRPGLGLDFQAEVEAAVSMIQKQPQLFPLYKNSRLRKRVLQRFPYNIFYLEMDSAIWIAAVAHHKRKPDYWSARTP